MCNYFDFTALHSMKGWPQYIILLRSHFVFAASPFSLPKIKIYRLLVAVTSLEKEKKTDFKLVHLDKYQGTMCI